MFYGTTAERLALDTTKVKAREGFIEDTGNEYEYTGSSWQLISSSGAKIVSGSPAPSSYTGDMTFTTSGTAFALATGTNQVTITNNDATNFGRFAYGESEAAAIANAATGEKLFPMAAASASKATMTRRRSANATHGAIVADTGSILVDVQQQG